MSRQPERLGRLLREYRRRAGLTQRQAADAAEISLAALRDIEQGRVSSPRTATLQRLAAALQVSSSQTDDLIRSSQIAGRTGVWIGILGPVSVWIGDREIDAGSMTQRTLLALLALSANAPVDRTVLIEAAFGAHPPANAVELLQTHISRLRRRLTPAPTRAPHTGAAAGKAAHQDSALLVASYGGYQLNVGPDQLDLSAFRHAIDQARDARRDGAPTRAATLYGEAARLWQGPPLADLPGLHTHPAVVALVREWHSAILDYADLVIGTADANGLVPLLREVIVADPLHEGAHARLMLALAATGQQAAALTMFNDLRHRLADELGTSPGTELSQAHQRILRGDVPHILEQDRQEPGRFDGPRQLPADIARFTGRANELKALRDLLPDPDQGTAPVTVVVEGMGGVGKTTLAVHFAHEVASRFVDGQLYVNLRGFGPTGPPLTAGEALRGFLDAFAVPPDRIPREVHEMAALYRSLLAGKKVLVLLDNAADVTQIRPLLPASPTCMVIVTSRRQQAGLVALEGAAPLVLDALSEDEAKILLAGHLGAELVEREPFMVTELIEACARLPLALRITAARAATNRHLSLTDLAGQLRDTQARLDTLTTGDETADVRAVFHWSYQALSPDAAGMFRLLGLHPGPDVTAAAAASLTGVAPGQARALLTELTRAHLLAEHTPGRYVFHDLLRAYAIDQTHRVDSAADRELATRRMLSHYLHTAHAADIMLDALEPYFTPEPIIAGVTPEPIADEQQALAWFDAEHEVLLAVIREAATDFDTYAWQIPWATVTRLGRRGRWHDLATVQRIALAAAERQGNPQAQAAAHHHLGRAHAQLRDMDVARSHFHRGADLYAEIGDTVGQAQAHYGIGLLMEASGDTVGALEEAHQAYTHFRTAGHRPGEARSLNAIGWCHALLGNHHEALDYCQRARDLNHEAGNEREKGICLDSLGYIHHRMGNDTEALENYQIALAVSRKLKDTHQEAMVLEHIGDTYADIGDTAKAITAWRQALSIFAELNLPGKLEVSRKLGQHKLSA